MPAKATAESEKTFKYGSRVIAYRVRYRQTNRLTIDVHPDLTVIATAPMGKNPVEIHQRVRKRANWIAKQLRYFWSYHPLPQPRRYRSGESIYYLGRQYKLKITHSKEESVKLTGGFLRVETRNRKYRKHIEQQIHDWYRERAHDYISEKFHQCIDQIKGVKTDNARLQLRSMTSRWGSCSKAGTITLNLDLIKTPSHCIEYVIIHELCHLRHHDHSPAFFRLLEKNIPEWRHTRVRLNKANT